MDEGKRHRQHRSPLSITQFPQERHKDRSLQHVRQPDWKVALQEREYCGNKEQLVPNPDSIDADEQPADLVRPGHIGPVVVRPRADEVVRQDQVTGNDDDADVRPLCARPRPTAAHREADRSSRNSPREIARGTRTARPSATAKRAMPALDRSALSEIVEMMACPSSDQREMTGKQSIHGPRKSDPGDEGRVSPGPQMNGEEQDRRTTYQGCRDHPRDVGGGGRQRRRLRRGVLDCGRCHALVKRIGVQSLPGDPPPQGRVARGQASFLPSQDRPSLVVPVHVDESQLGPSVECGVVVVHRHHTVVNGFPARADAVAFRLQEHG